MSKSKKELNKKPTIPTNNEVPKNKNLEGQKTSATFFSQKWWREGVIFLLAFFLYANTLGNQFAQDDAIVIEKNEFTQQGISGIGKIFGGDTFLGFFREKKNLVAGGRYRPLSLAMFALEAQFFGTQKTENGKTIYQYSPFVGHLGNVLLFGFTCVLLFWVLLSLFDAQNLSDTGGGALIAFLTILWFVAHPIHTEAVANIKGRDEILALLGSLSTLFFLIKYVKTERISQLVFAAISFLLALLSKENAITFVAIIPVAVWLFLKPSRQNLATTFTVLLGVSLVFMIIRTSVIGFQFGGSGVNDFMNDPYQKLVNNQFVPMTAAEKMATILPTLGKYVSLLIAPLTLTHDYYPREFDLAHWSDWKVLASLLTYLGLAFFVFKHTFSRTSQWRVEAFGMLFYLASLSIVSNLLFPVGTHMGERFAFMPSVGFLLTITAILVRFVGNKNVLYGIFTAIVAVFGLKTVSRNSVWFNDFTLFTTDIETSVNSAKLQNSVAGITIDEAIKKNPIDKKMIQSAIPHAERAIELHPNYSNAYLLKGNALLYLDDFEASIATYRAALAKRPDYGDGRNNLAFALRKAGQYYGEQKGDLAKAQQYLTESLSIKANDAETLRLLGISYALQRNFAQAIAFFEKSVALNPNDAKTLGDIAQSYAAMGNMAKAKEWSDKIKK
ncbi:MAG: hypothetical protein RL757_2993 [Bacteroidota bacterium]|jgi:tetratricopeptide (TPR) repeat protein